MKYFKKRINNILKSSKIFNTMYIVIGSLTINILKMFIRTDDKLILFLSFGGNYYNDSPKYIYEKIINDPRFEEYKFIWALKDPSKASIPGKAEVIKVDTLKYFIKTLKSRVWVSNAPVERRLFYKGRKTFFFCTWHGTPIKNLGGTVSSLYDRNQYDVMTAQSDFEIDIFKESFNLNDNQVVPIGLPRNDRLVSASKSDKHEIREKLNISKRKKVILYCPTYRDWKKDYKGQTVDFNKWYDVLGKEYVVLFRAHSKIMSRFNIESNRDFVYDVSNHHDLNELMIASDILISDYSSVFFDYSILEKPMFCYTYDYDEYVKHRGVYFDIREKLLGGSITEDELLELILNTSYEEAVEITKEFKEEFVNYYGKASIKSVDYIYNKISVTQRP